MAGASPVRSLRGPMRMPHKNYARRVVTVGWAGGLHIRPGVVLVDTAKRFKSRITIGVPATGSLCLQDERDIKTILSGGHTYLDIILASVALGAVCGTRMIVEAKGRDAEEAADEIVKVFKMTFEEIDEIYKRIEGGKR